MGCEPNLKHVEMRIEPKEQGIRIVFSDSHRALAQKLAALHRAQCENAAAKSWEWHARKQAAQRVQQILVRLKLDSETFS